MFYSFINNHLNHVLGKDFTSLDYHAVVAFPPSFVKWRKITMTENLGKDIVYHSCCCCGGFVEEKPEGGYHKIKTWVEGGIVLKTICNSCLEKWIIGEIKLHTSSVKKKFPSRLRFE